MHIFVHSVWRVMQEGVLDCIRFAARVAQLEECDGLETARERRTQDTTKASVITGMDGLI